MSPMRLGFLGLAFIGLVSLPACDTQEPSTKDEIRITNFGPQGTEFSVTEPARLRSIRDLDPDAIRAVVRINGVENNLVRNSVGQFEGQVEVPAQSNFLMNIEFYELYAGQQLTLAVTEQPVNTGSQDVRVSIARNDYEYDLFDFDSDGVSNIVERENNTSPLDAAQSPALVSVDVLVSPPDQALLAGFSNYQIETRVGSEVYVENAGSGPIQKTFVIPRQESLSIDVRIVESFTGQQLVVATQSREITVVQQAQSVVFASDEYDYQYDQDADGVSDFDELVAGSDPLSAPGVTTVPYSLTFEVPAEITDTSSVYSTLLIDGVTVPLTRAGADYSAASTVVEGGSANIEVRINDTYLNQAVTLATFTAVVEPVANENFVLRNFLLNYDTDGDGILNYVELDQGSDPFNAPPQVCTRISERITLSLSDDAYVDAGAILNNDKLYVDYEAEVSLLRYQYDPSFGDVTAAELTLTVGSDQGFGLVSIYAAPDFEWNDAAARLTLPALQNPVGSLNSNFARAQEYTFAISPNAITEDFTLLLSLESDDNDVAFSSSDSFTPPILQLTVARCVQ